MPDFSRRYAPTFHRDRAILREAGGALGEEWYVRFGRRQLLNDWMNQHGPEQVREMYEHTAMHEGIPLRILELFPIVEPTRIVAARMFWMADLQESDLEMLRAELDRRALTEGLQIEPETVKLVIDDRYSGRGAERAEWLFQFSAIAR